MTYHRRDVIKLGALAAASLRMPRGVSRSALHSIQAADRYPRVGDPALRELTAKALDAATAAGASYADVRLTFTRKEKIEAGRGGFVAGSDSDMAEGAIGVRALADGAWGFAASPLWSLDEAARLGRDAALQASTNARARRRTVILAERPAVAASGHWATPIHRDPFTIPLAEKLDVLWGLLDIPYRMDLGTASIYFAQCVVRHMRQEKTWASTDGAFCTQTFYQSDPRYYLGVDRNGMTRASSELSRLRFTAGGWDLLADPSLFDDIPGVVEQAVRMLDAEYERVQPGRYDVVCDAQTVSRLVARTVGVAAELDRVLGYEANAGGTSYLAPPAERLGSFALGPAFLQVTADRSRPGGLATVRWDDDGVTPETYPLIKDGILVDYATSREVAPELADRYAATGRPVRSHGGAGAESALAIPLVHPPNLTLHPGATATTFEDLVAGLEHGLVMEAGTVDADRQQLNGEITNARVYEVRNGKRTGLRFIANSQALFRAPELWKSLQALGGPATQDWFGLGHLEKGQPAQEFACSVGAVPARFKQLAITTLR